MRAALLFIAAATLLFIAGCGCDAAPIGDGDMSTPLFIRTPIIGAQAAVAGHAIANSGQVSEFGAIIVPAVLEPTLIEQILWQADVVNTRAGRYYLLLRGPDDINEYNVGGGILKAGTASIIASGVIGITNDNDEPSGIVLPVGWGLMIAHSVLQSDDVTYDTLGVAAFGGIIR